MQALTQEHGRCFNRHHQYIFFFFLLRLGMYFSFDMGQNAVKTKLAPIRYAQPNLHILQIYTSQICVFSDQIYNCKSGVYLINKENENSLAPICILF